VCVYWLDGFRVVVEVPSPKVSFQEEKVPVLESVKVMTWFFSTGFGLADKPALIGGHVTRI